MKPMDESNIPRMRTKLATTLTLWVSDETKAKYNELKEVYRVRVAECMRSAVERELERLLLECSQQDPPAA